MKVVFRLAALTLSLLVAFILAEAGLRIAGMGFGNSPMEPDAFLHHVHPKNYTFVQQHPSGELGGFRIDYNAEGRVVRSNTGSGPQDLEPSSPPCRVALMGDSFTEGGQVPFPESFAGKLEQAAGEKCAVRNYGVRSYSPAIYLVQYTRVIRPWKPHHVFVLLFGNDLREDVTYMSTSVRDAAGFPTAIQGPSDGWLFSLLRQLYVARFARAASQRLLWAYEHKDEAKWTVGGVVEENPDWSELTANLVLELNRRVREDGGQLIVMAVPSRYRLMGDGSVPVAAEDFHHKVMTWAQANGLQFLDLDAPFRNGVDGRAGALLSAGHPLYEGWPCGCGRRNRQGLSRTLRPH